MTLHQPVDHPNQPQQQLQPRPPVEVGVAGDGCSAREARQPRLALRLLLRAVFLEVPAGGGRPAQHQQDEQPFVIQVQQCIETCKEHCTSQLSIGTHQLQHCEHLYSLPSQHTLTRWPWRWQSASAQSAPPPPASAHPCQHPQSRQRAPARRHTLPSACRPARRCRCAAHLCR